MVCTRAHAFAASLVPATVFALPSLAQGVDADQIATTRRQMNGDTLQACSRRRRSLASEVQSDSKPHFRDDLCRNRMHRLFRDAGLWGTPRSCSVLWRGRHLRRRGVGAAKSEGMMQIWADQFKVRYVFVSRVGMQGSSGNHAERRFPKETIVMNAVTDALKIRLGLDKLALAGHSGGSTIAASLLTMGRNDVTCAVLGSAPLDRSCRSRSVGSSSSAIRPTPRFPSDSRLPLSIA